MPQSFKPEHRRDFWEEAKNRSFEDFLTAVEQTINNDANAVVNQIFNWPSAEQAAMNIEIMSKMPLAQSKFGEKTESEFELKGKEYSVRFSNRRSSLAELRGDLLRKQLNKNKQNNLSVLDAINKIAQNPEATNWMYFRQFCGSVMSTLPHDEPVTELVPITLEDMKILHAVFSSFIADTKARGSTEEQYKEQLKKLWPELIDIVKQHPPYSWTQWSWRNTLKNDLDNVFITHEAGILVEALQVQNGLLKTKGQELLEKVKATAMQYPEDRAILLEVLRGTNAFIANDTEECDADTKKAQCDQYATLIQRVSQHRHWGKTIATAMLAVLSVSIITLCIASGLGALVIPGLSLGLGYLIGIGGLSVAAPIASLGFFATETKRNQALEHIENACKNVENAVVSARVLG